MSKDKKESEKFNLNVNEHIYFDLSRKSTNYKHHIVHFLISWYLMKVYIYVNSEAKRREWQLPWPMQCQRADDAAMFDAIVFSCVYFLLSINLFINIWIKCTLQIIHDYKGLSNHTLKTISQHTIYTYDILKEWPRPCQDFSG